MTEHLIQGTEEWLQARLGKVTGSRIHDVMARTPSGEGWGATRDAYMAELICERLTGQRYVKFKSKSMERGNEVEDDARKSYEFRYDVDVIKVGFVPHPTIAMAGCSPDGLVGANGLIEIKSPDTHTHLKRLLDGPVNGIYIKQIQWQLACTGRQWCDPISYDPRFPEVMSLVVDRIQRDESIIADMEACVVMFLSELDIKLRELRARFEPKRESQPQPMPVGMMP